MTAARLPGKISTRNRSLLTHIMQVWREDGLPPDVPLLDTETNAHGGEASVEIFGALWLGDTFAGFLTAGGKPRSTTMRSLTRRLTRRAPTAGARTTCSWWTRITRSRRRHRSSLPRSCSPRSGRSRLMPSIDSSPLPANQRRGWPRAGHRLCRAPSRWPVVTPVDQQGL